MSDKDLEDFHNIAAVALNDLRKAFTRPVRMTLIIRDPTDTDSEVCITDDQIPAVEKVLERMKERKRKGMI